MKCLSKPTRKDFFYNLEDKFSFTFHTDIYMVSERIEKHTTTTCNLYNGTPLMMRYLRVVIYHVVTIKKQSNQDLLKKSVCRLGVEQKDRQCTHFLCVI